MKKFKLTILLVFITNIIVSQENPIYDSILAKKLDADEYGMKQYIFVILKSGKNQNTNKQFIDSCFASHMDNIKNQVKLGKLIVAGPIFKNEKSYRGIFILNVKTFEEANEILKHDLAIKEELLEVELFKWYGSAALPEYLESSDKIWKKSH
jgi:uncharacterized protein